MINAIGTERRFSVSPSPPSAQHTPPPVTPRAKLSFGLQSSKGTLSACEFLTSFCGLPLDRWL